MIKVGIYGAGSIGNHLAYACRSKGWQVSICDIDAEALKRARKDIYPARYGKWDEEIALMPPEEMNENEADLVIIGTPPDTHMKVALEVLKKRPPRVLLIEKPLCPPSLEGCAELAQLAKKQRVFVGVGYNHTLTKNTVLAAEILKKTGIGQPLTIAAGFREYWGGIFTAHPWLSGPQDTYLGYAARGGGASGEHSHAINIWQHFARLVGAGRVVEVSAMLDLVDDGRIKYDRICQLNLRTETGLVGCAVQDVITEPPQKYLRLQGDKGYVEWQVNNPKGHDSVSAWDGRGEAEKHLIPKNRPDDFKGEIDHVERILNGEKIDSPIALDKGLETMLVIAAAHIAAREKRAVTINYDQGGGLNAIS